jgi:multiple antibiotic resistance protein
MEALLSAALAYFVIIDPIGVSIIFNALTDGRTVSYCRRMAIRSVSFATALTLVFGFWGASLLQSLGIQMASFKIAGGLLIFYAAFGMITKPETPGDQLQVSEQEDISVYPLTIPLIAGPGTLTMTVLLFSQAGDEGSSYVPLIVAILAVYLMTLGCFLGAKPLARIIGKTINNIFKRLLGVLLASLAIQFIADGIKALAI